MNEITSFKTLIGSLYKKLTKASSYGTLDVKNLLLLDTINEYIYDCPTCYNKNISNKLKDLVITLQHSDKDICIYREQKTNFSNIIGCKDCSPNNQNLLVRNTPPLIDNYIIENIELELNIPFLFTREMFTNNYYDKESDLANNVRIITLPTSGILYYNDIPVVTNFIFNINDVNKLKYIRNSEQFISETFTFRLSDNNINSLFSTNTTITLNFNEIINLPPDIVGNNNKIITHQNYIEFTKEDFTTDTLPVYHDPELDAPYKLKILSLPIYGTLKYNNVDAVVNQEILLSNLVNEKLIYTPLYTFDEEYIVEFTYAISDIGSMEYTQ